ncbi:MAG: PLD nuclease N-terminal domain-containing protein [Patescibacteria group bacterium]|jgi:hypothetical protein
MDDTMFILIFGLMGLFIPLLGLASLAFWVWMLVDCLQRKLAENDKILWMLVIIFGNIIGALIYFFMIKNKK